MPATIMLVGAPQAGEWSEADLTVRDFVPAFKHVIDDAVIASLQDENDKKNTSADTQICWRSIPLKEQYLHTGWSQPDWIYAHAYEPDNFETESVELSFLTSISSSGERVLNHQDPESSELSQHLEESFALHEQASPSQVTPAAKTPLFRKHVNQEDQSYFELGTQLQSSSSPTLPQTETNAGLDLTSPKTPLNGRSQRRLPYLADLATFPSAAELIALEPQTVTFDILVGIICVNPARTVKIRRTGRNIDLVEVVVGDETRAGFSITFWLPEHRVTHSQDTETGFRPVVESLQRGDIVGMRNIALRHFKGRVHGQSLGRSGKDGWETQIFKLEPVNGPQPSRRRTTAFDAKLALVRTWAGNFVRRSISHEEQSRAKRRKTDCPPSTCLPPDETQ